MPAANLIKMMGTCADGTVDRSPRETYQLYSQSDLAWSGFSEADPTLSDGRSLLGRLNAICDSDSRSVMCPTGSAVFAMQRP